MSFDLTLTTFTGRTATFQAPVNIQFNSIANGATMYENNTANDANVITTNNNNTSTVGFRGNAVSGVHEIYLGAGFYSEVGNNANTSNLFNTIFYTDSAGGFHTSAISTNSYSSTSNTFQVVVNNATAANTGFGTGNLVVSNGNAAPITATFAGQTTSGTDQILTYQLGSAPTSSGTYHVYASGYNRAIDSTPTLNVAVHAAPTPAPCYVTGTRIRVLRGLAIHDVPVERLRVGDVALTASGKPRPIRWIGTRVYPGLTAPRHDRPVRIRAGALAENVPARDLLVSPDHCLWLDGLLLAAGHLVNGASITRGEAVADLTYWHVELDNHDMLLAEGTPAESFLAALGVRGQFDGVESDDASDAGAPYAERVEHGPELAALRERLILRAGLSIEPTRFGAVRAWMDRCDGRSVAGWAQDAEHPDAPVCLDIVVDGTVVAMTLAEEYRADIAAAGVGDGRHGFDVDLDKPLSAGNPHVVEVRRSADGLRVCAMEVDAAGAWTALLAA